MTNEIFTAKSNLTGVIGLTEQGAEELIRLYHNRRTAVEWLTAARALQKEQPELIISSIIKYGSLEVPVQSTMAYVVEVCERNVFAIDNDIAKLGGVT